MAKVSDDLGARFIRGLLEAADAQQKDSGPLWDRLPNGIPRWWIRNTASSQVLGSVRAQSEDEALGKAMVKWGIAIWQRDGFTATTGGRA